MSDAVIVTGVTETDLMLRTIEKNLQRKAIRKATRESAREVQKDARQLAPVDSGELVDSLKVRAIKKRRNAQGHGVSAGSEFEGGGELAYYAVMVEFGTVRRRTKSGENRGVIHADPFLRPALYGNKQKVLSTFHSVLREAIRSFGK